MARARKNARQRPAPLPWRWYALAAIVAVIVLAVLVWPPDPAIPGTVGVREGQIAQDFTVTTTSGAAFTLSAQRGSVVIIDFMGSFCSTCASAVRNSLRPVYDRFASAGLKIVSVDVNRETNPPLGGGSVADVVRFASDNGVIWSIGLDTSRTAVAYQATGSGVPLPTLLVIDKDGVIVKRHRGILSEADLAAIVSPLL